MKLSSDGRSKVFGHYKSLSRWRILVHSVSRIEVSLEIVVVATAVVVVVVAAATAFVVLVLIADVVFVIICNSFCEFEK